MNKKTPRGIVDSETELAMMQDLGVSFTLAGISYEVVNEQVFYAHPYRIGIAANSNGHAYYALVRSYTDPNRIYFKTAEEVLACINAMRGFNEG